MGTITVYFIGICTHMHEAESEIPGLRHRVVLVNGRIPRKINGNDVPSHVPRLCVAPEDLVVNGVGAKSSCPESVLEWDLRGSRVDIANAVGDELKYEWSYKCCIPHLRELTPDLPPPSKEVVLAGDSEKASCYFDVTAGVFTAGYLGAGAATAVLKVTTSDAPIVRVHKFGTTEWNEFHLRDGADIALTNVGAELNVDDENDFLLHYETAESIPPNAGVPTQLARCCTKLEPSYIVNPKLSVGPGCSNSDFP
jgi:hypothetical protein